MLVHFPIAIAFIWLVLEAISWALEKRRRDLDFTHLILAILGGVSAFFANMTGEMAEHLQPASGAAAEAIKAHSELASYIVWFYLLLTVVSAVILVVKAQWLRIIRFGIAFGLTIVVVISAWRGARLVYEFGFGIQRNEVLKTWQTPSTK